MIQICGINMILLREKLTEYFLSYMALLRANQRIPDLH